MSRRTAEANKAIRLAWENEVALVKKGEGTRDWTQEQQKDILEHGKAYDDNGKAFEGQHMKSVAEYPEYQGNPDNIQFLTKEEHLEAHKGNWQNPTNWQYNPMSKTFIEFGDEELIPCEASPLTKPIIVPEIIVGKYEKKYNNQLDKSVVSEKTPDLTQNEKKISKRKSSNWLFRNVQHIKNKAQLPLELIKQMWEFEKPQLLDVATDLIDSVLVEKISGYFDEDDDADLYASSDDENDMDSKDDCREESSDKAVRKSPKEHDVDGYKRFYKGREIKVRPYKRGGKKE